MKRKTFVSSVLILLFVISVFPISTLSGAAASHGSSGVSESKFTAAKEGNTNRLVPDTTNRARYGSAPCSPIPRTSDAADPLSATASVSPYQELLGLTFTQNSSSMSYNVTAVAQDYADTYLSDTSNVTGPAYLLNGLSDQGYYYQVGLSWDWYGENPLSPYYSSIYGPYTPGFNAIYAVYAPDGTQVYPPGGFALLVSLSVNQGDSVQLTLNFSGGNVLMYVHDWNTGAASSETYSSYGATTFVGLPNNPQTPAPLCYFSGLMTEQLHTNPYTDMNMQEVVYSNMAFAKYSAWMWMQEMDSAGNFLFAVSTSNPVSFVGSSTAFQLFNSSGATEYSNAYQFVTGTGAQFSAYNFYISILPASFTMLLGTSLLFTSSVSGGSSPYSYLWYLNGAPVSDATSSSWTFTPQSAGSYTIWAGVTDSAGTMHAASNTSTVTVNGPLSVSISPSSFTMPVSGLGSVQPFPSTVSGGLPPYTYQWYLKGQPVPVASGGTAPTWVFYPPSTGPYTVYVIVNDSVGAQATSNTATGTVTVGGIDVYCYNQNEPAPMGIADYGIGPSGPYQYNTSSFVGIVTVNSLLTLMSGSSDTEASFQLNVVLQINTIYGPLVFWLQDVAVVNTNGQTLSFDDFSDNLWNFTTPNANIPLAYYPDISGGGNPMYHTSTSEPYGYMCSREGASWWQTYPGRTRTDPTNFTLEVNSWVSSSGQPTVSFAFDIGYGLKTYDTVTFTNVAGFTSLAGFEVNGFNYTPAGFFYDSALILGGQGGGQSTTDVLSDVQLQLEYWNGHNYQMVPNAYNFGSNTGEAIDNVTCGFSHSQGNGTIYADMLPGASQAVYLQLGPLYDQSQTGVIDINSPLASGTLYVANYTNPNAVTWQIPFVSGEVTVTLYPGSYDLQLYNQNNQLFDEGNFTVSAGQTLSLQTPFSPLSASLSPSSVVLDVGQSQTFTSSVSGGASPYSYQWYLNGAPVSGATSSSWTFTPSSAGIYTVYVNVTDNVGVRATSNAATATVASVAVNSWPMFRQDLTHTGYSTSTTPNTKQTLWTYATGGYVSSSPAVVGGVVFVGSLDDNVYALNATTGTKIWNYTTGGRVSYSSPAVVGGLVYVGSDDDNVYCLNATSGALVWRHTTGSIVNSCPAVVGGVVYVGSGDGKVYALNAATGALVWSYATGPSSTTGFGSAGVWSSPAVTAGIVFVGSYDNKTYALNAVTGALVWSYTTGGPVDSSPAVVDGVVYVGSNDSNVYALNAATGALIWKFATGGGVFSSPAVADGVVFVGSWDAKVYALNATTGAQVWSYSADYWWYWSSPAVAGGIVFVGSQDGYVYALNAATGALVWSYATGDTVDSSPTVVGGVVFVGSNDGKVYAFGACALIPGDINGDGRVSLVDLVLLTKAYGSRPGDPNWNSAADINGDGIVDLSDLVTLAKNYGQSGYIHPSN